MKCTLSWAVALATAMAAATANAALVSSSVDITTTVVAGNPTITTGPYTWATAFGSNPAISMAGENAGNPNSLVNVALVSDTSSLMSITFKAPAGSQRLDKISWATINGAASGATYTLRLINLGTADPNTAYATAGTDLFNGGAGLTFVHPGTPNNQLLMFDFTGADEVSLTPGNTYAFELVNTAGTGEVTFTRTGGANSLYADGQYWKALAAPAVPPPRVQASSAGARDAVAGVYIVIPEPSTLGIASCSAVLGLMKFRRRK